MNDRAYLPAAILFACLVLGYLLFVGYISLFLTDFVSPARLALAGADELFFRFDEFRLRWWNLRDISNNLLLYMPLGFLVAMLLTSLGGRLASHGVHRWWGFVLSVGVEVAQAFIGRFSDATDVLSNGSGYLLGFAIARYSVTGIGLHPASLFGQAPGNRLDTLAGLRFIYVALVIVIALLPLDFVASVFQISAKLVAVDGEAPRFLIDPLFHFRSGVDFRTLMQLALPFLPLAFLSGFIQLRRPGASPLLPAVHCLLTGGVVETIDLITRSGRSDVAVPLLGFAIGFSVAWSLGWASRRCVAPGQVGGRYLPLGTLILYGAFLLAVTLAPYQFDLSVEVLRSKLFENANLWPFRWHIAARSVNAAVDIAREFLLYVPSGTLLVLCLKRRAPAVDRPVLLLIAAAAVGMFAASVELLQLAVVGRYVDITDVLLAVGGGLAGVLIAPLFSDHVSRS